MIRHCIVNLFTQTYQTDMICGIDKSMSRRLHVFQDISGKQLNGGSDSALHARPHVLARAFWESQRLALLMLGYVNGQPSADLNEDLILHQVYLPQEKKKRLCVITVFKIEQGTLMPLAFTTTSEMGEKVWETLVHWQCCLLQRH